ncbi:MAG: FG-GAP-like repeat-containing protein [Desulfobacteraceae bacterium]|jgi:TolB-like protein
MCNQRNNKLARSALFKTAMMVMAAGIVFASATAAWAAAVTRILVVPFKVHAGQDLAFLQRGITEMLVSRLGQNDEVVVVAAGRPGDDVAALADKNQADYVVLGSLTVLGDRVSTDSRVFKGTQLDNPVLSFGRTGRRQDDIIDHIDALANQINTRILGRKTDPPSQVGVPPAPVTPPSAVAAPKAEPPAAPSTQAATGTGSPLLSRQRDAEALAPIKLQGMSNFREQLSGLAVGDADGNGAMEIVTVSNGRLTLFRLTRGRWIKMAQYDGSGKFIGVDMADVNHNGRNEIFVTNFDNTEARVISFVMEWDGQSLKRIAGNLPWYFRTVDVARRGKILVGQKQGIGDRFSPGIYEMKWQAGTYGPGDRLPLPRKLNVFGFAYGAVRSADKLEVVTYNSSGYVQLLDRKGSEAFVSTETYGGGANAIVFTNEEQWDEQDHIFLQPRIQLHDLNGDGLQEILVVNNQSGLPGAGALVRHRYYKKGRIEWLGWHSQGIRSVLHGLDMARFIADCALVDLDGDGDLEIVAAVVKDTAGALSKGSSYLTVFDMN